MISSVVNLHSIVTIGDKLGQCSPTQKAVQCFSLGCNNKIFPTGTVSDSHREEYGAAKSGWPDFTKIFQKHT